MHGCVIESSPGGDTQFSFAGQPDAAHPELVTPGYDDRKFTLDAPLTGVSAKEQKIPDLPIVAIAEDEVSLQVAARGASQLHRKLI